MSKPGIVLCHMGKISLENRVLPKEGKRIIDSTIKLIGFGKEFSLPLITSLYDADEGMYEEIEKELREYNQRRHSISSFDTKVFYFSKEDAQFMQKQGVLKFVILAGIYSDGCMSSTAEESFNRGYRVITAADLTDNCSGMGKKYLKEELTNSLYGHPPYGNFFESTDELIKKVKLVL